jgi:predicted transposase YbfD/YdcC
MLAEVPDLRKPRGKRHPLSAILGLAVVAMLCGYRSYSAIAQWGRTYPPQLAVALGFTHPKTPCASTFHYCFKTIDTVALEKTLSEWAAGVLEDLPDEVDKAAVAMDGKTLCGSANQGAHTTHLLSVVSHQLGITLAQRPVSEKTNEIPVATQILEAFDVAGKVVTTDALLTQRTFCQNLCDADADYALPVKANQKSLLDDIRTLFEPEPSETKTTAEQTEALKKTHDALGAHLDTDETIEKGHGWIEMRTLTASTALTDYLKWPGLAQVYQYRTERTHTRTGKKNDMIQYGITSLTPERASAARLLALRRGHWAIENLSHRTRDMLLGEDASQVRCGSIPQVMYALRNAVISLLRTSGHTEIADALRYFAAQPEQALELIGINTEN